MNFHLVYVLSSVYSVNSILRKFGQLNEASQPALNSVMLVFPAPTLDSCYSRNLII